MTTPKNAASPMPPLSTPRSSKASDRAMVPFVSVDNMLKLVNRIGIAEAIAGIAEEIERDYHRWPSFDKTERVPAHSEEGVIELMPTSDGVTYSFKYVNGHPANMARGYQTVSAFGLLARVDTGYPILLSEMTILTALRTAAMSVTAAKFLAPRRAKTMALIGNGAQCEFQALAFQKVLGIDTVRLYDIDPNATQKATRNLMRSGMTVVPCSTGYEAVTGADIITTCTADKQYATVLSDNMVGAGQHINAIGGDCPGKTELHRDILLRADIFVEYAPQTRIEGEIQQLAPDHTVTELWHVITGAAPGRMNDTQITLFDSVGFATEDFSALRYIHDRAREHDLFEDLDMIADPDDPRDLFGMITRAGGV